MIGFRDYDVRVWADGDVNVNCRDHLGYMQMGGVSGTQSNCDGGHLGRALDGACADVANAMRALDEVIEAIEVGR